MNYMFEFEFLMGTINGYIHRWCKEREIDTVNSCGYVYADIYGTNEYRKMEPVHVINDTFEVYATDEVITAQRAGFSRIFPLKERCVKVHYPLRKLCITLEDGFTFNTEIENPSRYISDFLSKTEFMSPDKRSKRVARYAVIG